MTSIDLWHRDVAAHLVSHKKAQGHSKGNEEGEKGGRSRTRNVEIRKRIRVTGMTQINAKLRGSGRDTDGGCS